MKKVILEHWLMNFLQKLILRMYEINISGILNIVL